jgi:hypothetical protein
MKIVVVVGVVAGVDRFRLNAEPEIQMIANHNSPASASRDFMRRRCDWQSSKQ